MLLKLRFFSEGKGVDVILRFFNESFYCFFVVVEKPYQTQLKKSTVFFKFFICLNVLRGYLNTKCGK